MNKTIVQKSHATVPLRKTIYCSKGLLFLSLFLTNFDGLSEFIPSQARGTVPLRMLMFQLQPQHVLRGAGAAVRGAQRQHHDHLRHSAGERRPRVRR
jgi:hypothetical protein